MNIYTIGFTKKNAETFFNFLKESNVNALIDVRLNNVSQLAGFAKKNDLRFFLRELCSAEYIHYPDLAPTKILLKAYKCGDITWKEYEDKFMNLLAQSSVERSLEESILDRGCLLCSEHEPHFCHRRLVVDYLNEHMDIDFKVTHLY